MGIVSQERRLNTANPYQAHEDDPDAGGSSTPGAVNGPPGESYVGHANNGLQPSQGHPVAYPEYPPVPHGGGSAPLGGGFAPQASALPPMSVAMPVHAVPVHHVYGGPDPNAPSEGPYSDRCCEDECCCPICRGCFEPATHCCRCPPWYIVTAYVLICVSAMFNWFALEPFFMLDFGVELAPGAAFAAGLNLPTAAARAQYNLAQRHFRVGGVAFDGEDIIVWNALETELSRVVAGEDMTPEVRGSYLETVFKVRDVDCDRMRGFYRGGEHHSMGMDGRHGGPHHRALLSGDSDEDEDEDEDDDEDDDYDWSDYPFAPWAEDYDYGGYPGTRGCQATCEGGNFTSTTCQTDERFFCEWYMGKCWSAVGGEDCPADRDELEQMLADMEAWDGNHRSAREMNYRGIWPTKSAVRKVRDDCESVKDALVSAGGAEQTVRAFTVPLLWVAVILGGVLVGRCNPECRRNGCHSRLDSLGRALLGLMLVIVFVNTVCFAHYARVFPDMRDEKFDSVMFAVGLPVMVTRHDLVGVGQVEFYEIDRGGFGITVFVWMIHLVAVGCLCVAACTRSEVDDARPGMQSRGKRGRWWRPERENDPPPPGARGGFHFAMPPRQQVMHTAWGPGPTARGVPVPS